MTILKKLTLFLCSISGTAGSGTVFAQSPVTATTIRPLCSRPRRTANKPNCTHCLLPIAVLGGAPAQSGNTPARGPAVDEILKRLSGVAMAVGSTRKPTCQQSSLHTSQRSHGSGVPLRPASHQAFTAQVAGLGRLQNQHNRARGEPCHEFRC